MLILEVKCLAVCFTYNTCYLNRPLFFLKYLTQQTKMTANILPQFVRIYSWRTLSWRRFSRIVIRYWIVSCMEIRIKKYFSMNYGTCSSYQRNLTMECFSLLPTKDFKADVWKHSSKSRSDRNRSGTKIMLQRGCCKLFRVNVNDSPFSTHHIFSQKDCQWPEDPLCQLQTSRVGVGSSNGQPPEHNTTFHTCGFYSLQCGGIRAGTLGMRSLHLFPAPRHCICKGVREMVPSKRSWLPLISNLSCAKKS